MPFTEENAKNAHSFTAQLAFPRLVGSEGEKKAQTILEDELKSIGNSNFTENLKCSKFPINVVFRIVMPIGAFILTIAWLFSEPLFGLNNPIISLISAIIGCFWLLIASNLISLSFGRIPKIGKIFETKNFISEITPANPKAHLIYLAHYDSKSQLYPGIIRIILFIGGLISGLFYGIRLIFGSVIFITGNMPVSFWTPGLDSFLIMFCFNFLLIFNFVGNRSPGALDNAASVATILELSKVFKSDPPQNIKLTFVATAAEELGLYGAADFVKRRKGQLDPKTTFFLNYDLVGGKKARILTSFGIPLKKTSETLNGLIEEIVNEHSLEDECKKLFLPIGAATDHIPIQRAGFEVTCIVSVGSQFHTSKDTINKVKQESLKVVGILGFELAKKLDQRFKK